MRIAFYALHYGKEYLAWSIRSIQDAVDEVHVLYTDRPSFGHTTPDSCPEAEAELQSAANRFRTVPLFWHRGSWHNEGAHRGAIGAIAKSRGADLILVVDADELWAPGEAKAALDNIERDQAPGRTVRVRFVHFWRSFDWVCIDGAMPERIIDMRRAQDGGDRYLYPQYQPVYHFGYAQSERIVRYKWQIHGHQNELRPGWLQSKFLNWHTGIKDVHPTCTDGFWNPERTGRQTMDQLRMLLHDHPYWGRELIK